MEAGAADARAPAVPLAVHESAEVTPEHRFAGPLVLDLGRIVLPHRVENVPPPPAFIFEPFTPSRPRSPAPSAQPIDPRPCRVVDEHAAGRRIDRGFGVDVAPCIQVGAASGEPSRRQPRRRNSPAARSLVTSAVGAAPAELEAASA